MVISYNVQSHKISSADADWKLWQNLLHDTPIQMYHMRSDNLSFRALALYLSRTEEYLKHSSDTQELEGWRDGQI